MRLDDFNNKFDEMAGQFDDKLNEQGLEKFFSDPEAMKKTWGISDKDIEELNYECDFYCKHQEWGNAVSCFCYLIAVEPKNAVYYLRLGSIFMQMDKFTEAISVLEMSVSLNPNDPHPYLYMGSCFLQQNDFINAKDAFDECIETAKRTVIDDRVEVEKLAYEALECIK